MSFTDTKAIVTGGASGIGLATAKWLRRPRRSGSGPRSRRSDSSMALRELRCRPHRRRSRPGDRRGGDRRSRRTRRAREQRGHRRPGHSRGQRRRRMACVCSTSTSSGLVRVTRACLPALRRSSSASIVNTCSVAATVGLPERALYSASKGAVAALTLAMAADHLHEGIRVNCVAPGTADTPWIGRLLDSSEDPQAERAALEARQPHGRLVTAEEVAAAIGYLAGSNAGSTTGTMLTVDGGLTTLKLRPARGS